MNFPKIKIFLVSLLLLAFFKGEAQSYNMSNMTVSDCNASFYDSNNTPTENYNHNENLVFSICPNGADSIVLSFSSFCTELNLDVITFFDGPNTSSPQIGMPFSGNTGLPPTIIATSGCLTISFVSDASVNCSGWEASWQTIINTPTNPIFDPIPAQACNTNTITFTLDQDILCSSVNASNFSIFGPSAQTITSINPINCVGNKTNSLQVNFSPGADQNGTYQLQLDATFTDDCGNLWPLSAFGSFAVDGCPISAEILGDDTICLGECSSLTANAWDGDGNYTFVWNNGLPSNSGPHNVCPTTTTTYQVSVTDGTNAPAGIATRTVYVIQPVTMPANMTICQSTPNIDLDATPNTGYWNGPCFGNDTLVGIFHPSWCGTGVKNIEFIHYGCVNTMQITINPMSVGATNQLVCPGSPAFNIYTNNPGGTFTGNGITNAALGTFDPTIAGVGVHNITYANAPCPSVTKIITVGTATIQADDTLCSNDGIFTPTFSPKGGTWSGNGVTNWYWCNFDPETAGAGTHTLLYTYGNCVDTLRMTVFEVEAGNNLLKCVSNPPFNLTGASPAGGTWYGTGIIDPILGTFDPSANGGNNFNPWVYYAINGCVDSLRIYVRKTEIAIDPLPSFCDNDAAFTLNDANTGRTPWSGAWSGTGITSTAQDGTFTPNVAGQGTHTLYYTVNGCTDSTQITVFNNPNLKDTSICIAHTIFNIPNAVAGGIWSGTGIVNPSTGAFLPSSAGVGAHTITYITPNDCYYTMTVTVTAMPIVSINGLPNTWCLADTNFIINALPANGNWVGTTNDSIFNPLQAGSGNFNIGYSIGTGQCKVSASASIFIGDTLKVLPYFTDTILCKDDLIKIGASGDGGNPLNYTFSWNQGLGNSFENIVQPSSNTTYIVRLNDGCSQEDSATITINLQPEFFLDFETSDSVCYDVAGFAKVNVTPNGLYQYVWNTDPINMGTTINQAAGHSYKVIVTDINGCEKSEYVAIPSYSKLKADFTVSPKDECVDLLDAEIYIIDQSIGATQGSWTFGDGKSEIYSNLNGNISHFYEDTGTFQIFLSVTNGGNCYDVAYQEVCVIPKTLVLAPTAFSPNSDGYNDVFFLHKIGIGSFEMSIYDRWGEKVFETIDATQGWDGSFKNQKMEIGTYTWQATFHSLENNNTQTEKGSFQLIR